MSFNIGDVVVLSTRKGAVQYTVTDIPVPGEQITIKSENSGKETVVAPSRLTLVEAAPAANLEKLDDDTLNAIAQHVEDPNHDDTDTMPVRTTEQPMAAWEVELLFSDKLNPKRPFLLTVDHVTTDHKSYGAACDALIVATRQGFEHYAVIDQGGKRLATRTSV